MKFSEFKYERPNINDYEVENKKLIQKVLDNTLTSDAVYNAVVNNFVFSDYFETMMSFCYVKNSIDTKDEFFEKERAFWDENSPILQGCSHEMNEALLISPHRKYLEEKLGELAFIQMEQSKKIFKEEIIPFIQEENKLATEYQNIIASAKIEFDGLTYNLSQMAPFIQSIDRNVRKRAGLAVSQFFSTHEIEFDNIYDNLVKIRHQIAIVLGYDNFIQLGYDRMGRTDYNAFDVKTYRDQIYNDAVPIVVDLERRKAERLRIKSPMHYDIVLSFLSGNPTPKGDRSWMVDKAKKMYDEMSEDTKEFFNFMVDNELLDLDSKSGKAGGGYCTYFPNMRSPFIFANFNGTSHDVDVLTHEAGHAFQCYQSRDLFPFYRWPTSEACEIHSMSMEFFAWSWIHLFFEKDTPKYKYNHLANAISFLPYGVTVDEFQHVIYANPDLSPDERKKVWRDIEKKYMPYKRYDEDQFLDKGTWWYRQGHIFDVPFYYIDYTLAQVCAFQYWIANNENHEKAWENYVGLCKLGGSKSFVGLINAVNIKNPFVKGSVKKIIEPIQKYLNSIDDKKL